MTRQATAVQTYEDVVESVKAFNQGLEEDQSLRGQLSFFRAWYYIPELDAVGPSKFIGYKGMTAKEYLTRHSQELDGRVTEPVLHGWFEDLDRASAEGQYVAEKVKQLLQRYNKRPSQASRCGAPPTWRLAKSDSSFAEGEHQPGRQRGEEGHPLVEVFWRAFLSLYPEDQDVLAQRIISHRKV